MKKLRIHCLQHVAVEGPGCIVDWVEKNGHILTTTQFYCDEILPPMDDFDCLVVMGGPMGVYDEDEFLWIPNEKQFIKEAVDAGKPIVGVCLGAQFIATALGARVYAGVEKEIGWFGVHLSPLGVDSILAELDREFVFHWHGDTFDIPKGADLLASSLSTPHQAFLYKGNVLALQFHLEVNHKSIDGMVEMFSDELVSSAFVQSAVDILAQKEHVAANNQIMFTILDKLFVL